MKLVVFGASGGTGRAVIEQALAKGHEVTAFVRDASQFAATDALRVVRGDALQADDVSAALAGQDAVVLTLGDPQSLFARLLGARRTTAPNICEVATRHIVTALADRSELPVIVVSAFGVGDTRDALPLMFRLFYFFILRPQMADKEKQEALLKSSAVNYTLVQPLALTDKPAAGLWTETSDGRFGAAELSRADLAAFILLELEQGDYRRRSVTLSGHKA